MCSDQYIDYFMTGKQFHLHIRIVLCCFTLLSKCRLSREERERAIGMLQAGLSARRVSRMLHCSHPTIINLRDRFHVSGTTSDRPRPGRPRVTTANEDRQIQLWRLRDRFLTSTSSIRRFQRDTGRISVLVP